MLKRSFVASGLIASVLLAAAVTALADPVRYDGHRVVRVQVENEAQLESLLSISDDMWSEGYGIGPVDVHVSPEQYAVLEKSDLEFSVLIPDLQARIDAHPPGVGGESPWDHFMQYAEILEYLDTLVALRPGLAETFVIGQTVENRDIVGIRITGPGLGAKPGVLYHGAEHAREWITPPVVMYVADQLIRNYDTDPEIRDLVNRVEWFIVPVFNVDGYMYSWSNDRYWRKNRRNNGNGTWGVDLNRNWEFGWGGQGSSGNSGSDIYRGPSPFSEPETQAMRDFFFAHPNIRAHNDVHAYGQWILWPWGYIPDLPPDDPEFREVGNEMADIIRGVHGRNYAGGPVYTTLYPASGISIDWVYGELGILSYTFELRGPDFVIPPDQILPNAEEIFPAMLFLTDWVTTAVQITYPDGRPTIIGPGVEVEMRVDITAAAEEVDPDGATLHVRTESGGQFTPYPIEHVGGDEFLATFPARGCGDDTEYYVTALGDSGGIVFSPPGAPEEFYSAQVGTLATFFEDDFEADQGWTVENIDLQDGAWERGVPVGGGDRSDPPTDFDGSGSCYLTDNVDDNSDVDGGPTRLISPVFDLSDAVDPQLSYARWFQSVNGVPDQMDVEISDDNGSSWELIERVNSGGGWTVQNVRIKDFVTPTAQVRVRFSAVDNPNDSVTEAAVDAFSIFDLQCDAELLSIVHGNPDWDRNDAETWISFNDWSFGGYLDPKIESNNGSDVNLGLDTFNVVFSGEPFGDAVGGPVTIANVSVEVTGGAVPNIAGVVKNGDTLTVQLDRILTPQEWTTLVLDVYDSDGVRIIDNGNEGEGVDEAARLDVGFMPGDVNNNGATQPQDLSRWIRSWNDGNPIFPVDVSNGHPDDYLDISRGGGTQPQDLSRVIQLLSGTGDATQVWNGVGMNSARP